MNHVENTGKGHLSDEDINPKSREKKKLDKPKRIDRYDYTINKQTKKSTVNPNAANTTENIDPSENNIPNVDDIAKGTIPNNTNTVMFICYFVCVCQF